MRHDEKARAANTGDRFATTRVEAQEEAHVVFDFTGLEQPGVLLRLGQTARDSLLGAGEPERDDELIDRPLALHARLPCAHPNRSLSRRCSSC